jgi:ABC-type transport system substrate-binding protein
MDAGGSFADRQGNRMHVDFAVQDASEIERMQEVLSDSWRRAGFDVRSVVMGIQSFTNLETRHTLPGFSYAAGGTEAHFRASQVGSPANRWGGLNRSGWSNPEYERLYDAWNSTLDQTERGRYVAQMMALVSEGLPAYPLYFLPDVKSWVASLQGPAVRENSGFGRTSRATTYYWDIHNWTFTR